MRAVRARERSGRERPPRHGLVCAIRRRDSESRPPFVKRVRFLVRVALTAGLVGRLAMDPATTTIAALEP